MLLGRTLSKKDQEYIRQIQKETYVVHIFCCCCTDTDLIVVKPLYSLVYVVGGKSPIYLNDAALKFDKGNSFITHSLLAAWARQGMLFKPSLMFKPSLKRYLASRPPLDSFDHFVALFQSRAGPVAYPVPS